jgi:flagellar hook-basal body complex protein FliE
MKEGTMKRYKIRGLIALVSGSLLVLSIGCQEAPKPKAETVPAKAPSIGREYGETLHGAINQANEARKTVEKSSEQALGQMDNPGE